MANIQLAFGLRPISKLGSSTNSTGNSNYSMYAIANGNTDAIYQGQMVIPLTSGYIGKTQAAIGGNVSTVGVFWGCEYVSSVTGKPTFSNFWPGSGADSAHEIKAYVYDDPDQLFVIASDSTLTAEATMRTKVFKNARLGVVTGLTGWAGSSISGVSKAQLEVSSIATTNTFPLRILGWMQDSSNLDWTAAGVGVVVRLNNHFNAPNASANMGTLISTTGI
jgi:hypothetical protein